MSRTRLLTALAIVAVVVSAGWLMQRGARPGRLGFHFQWPAGHRYVYALEWTRKESARLPLAGDGAAGKLAGGSLDLAADLVVRSLGASGDGHRLRLGIERVRRHSLRVLDQELLADEAAARAALIGQEALVELGPDGAVRKVAFRPDAPDLWKHLMQTLVAELEVVVPADARAEWTASEPTALGRAKVRYRRQALSPPKLALSRERYETLLAVPDLRSPGVGAPVIRSQGEVILDPAGHLRRVEDRNAVTVQGPAGTLLDSEGSLRLELSSVGDFAVTPALLSSAAETEERRPGVPVVSAANDRRMLEQRVGGMTRERLLHDLSAYGNAGLMPDHNRWLWQVTGLLQLHPELCDALVSPFVSTGANLRSRALILDLLASAGHGRAQAVMRQVLDTSAARAEPRAYTMLLQRLGLVSHPEPATADYLWRRYREGQGAGGTDLRHASAYALGAAAGHLAKSGQLTEARGYGDRLAGELRSARDVPSRQALLHGLGNLGLEDHLPLVLESAADGDPGIRAAAAAALRTSERPEARAALLKLLADPGGDVQQETLRAFNGRTLAPADLAGMSAVVLAGGMAGQNQAALVSLLAQHLDAGPEPQRMLAYLLAHSTDRRLQARIRGLLAGAS